MARLFLTDYGSYNNGTQFEFGHWVDLDQFSDASEFMDYISDHFEECDEKSPLDDYGSVREETMFTDYEDFPESLYSECMSDDELQKIFDYLQIKDKFEDDDQILSLWNEYCQDMNYSDDEIYINDEDFFEMFYSKPMDAVRAAIFGSYNFGDDYVKFNGYGNLETFDNPRDEIDEDALLEWAIENADNLV